MNESANSLQSRFYLEAANYYYQQMELNFQDKTKFLYSLIAFLPIARSVTYVFQKEASKNTQLMNLYEGKVDEWKGSVLMRFFNELRNVSLKEHTPDTRIRVSLKWVVDVHALAEGDVMTANGPDGKPLTFVPTEPRIDKVIGYHFIHNFKWFNENPDVMYLCREYLNELETFVAEVENKVRGISHE